MIRHLPNLITISRLVLVVPAGVLLLREHYAWALAVIAIAGLSDFVDGQLARRFDSRSRFGEMADPLADKLLVAVVFIMLFCSGTCRPGWRSSSSADVVILAGALAYRLLFAEIDISPSLVSKTNTLVQIVMPILVLVSLIDLPPLTAFAAMVVDPWFFTVVATLSVWSGIDYVIGYTRKSIETARARERS